jgi:LysM repeat protein
MSEKDSAQNVIDSYRKRQVMAQKAPLIFGISALLLIVGAGVVIFWLTGPETPSVAIFATTTPTVTETLTPTPTATFTLTPTETATSVPTDTPTPTETATPSLPFIYVVQQDETLWGIAQKFNVDLPTLIALNPGKLNPENPVIYPNMEILIPAPGQSLPTPTVPPGAGTYDYVVMKGDTLESIATRYESTVDAILNANKDKLQDRNDIREGQILKIPAHIATPAPTWTAQPVNLTPGAIMTLTPAPSATPTP